MGIFINFAPKYKCYKMENSIVGREKEITELKKYLSSEQIDNININDYL